MAIDSSGPTSRRSLLSGVLAGVAATIAGSVGLARPARANDPNDVVKGAVNTTTNRTRIYINANLAPHADAFEASTTGDGYGVRGGSGSGDGVVGAADSSGRGVYGYSRTGTGVQGSTDPAQPGGTGVLGESYHIGVIGRSSAGNGEHYGVYGSSNSPSSRAIFGRSLSNTGGTGMWGQADTPGGVGVRGLAWNSNGGAGGYGTAIIGSSGSQTWPGPLPNTGVLGVGKNGRGGVFGGDLAQVRLLPSASPTHPGSGVLGDLFLDSNTRLWFCKGATTWVQLA